MWFFSRCVPERPPTGSGGEQEVDAYLTARASGTPVERPGFFSFGIWGMSCARGNQLRQRSWSQSHCSGAARTWLSTRAVTRAVSCSTPRSSGGIAVTSSGWE